jgi:hypothetical protein
MLALMQLRGPHCLGTKQGVYHMPTINIDIKIRPALRPAHEAATKALEVN